MRKISGRVSRVLERMPRMRTCEIGAWHPELGPCKGRIQWHHVWIYGDNQIDEVWAILGACECHHEAVKTDRRVREAFERRSLEIATRTELAFYPRKDWEAEARRLGTEIGGDFISLTDKEMASKARQIIADRARELRSKARAKRSEADRLDREAEELEAEAKKLQ